MPVSVFTVNKELSSPTVATPTWLKLGWFGNQRPPQPRCACPRRSSLGPIRALPRRRRWSCEASSCPRSAVAVLARHKRGRRARTARLLGKLRVNLALYYVEFSSLLTVKTLTGMTTDVYPRENCIAPAIVFIVISYLMDQEHKE